MAKNCGGDWTAGRRTWNSVACEGRAPPIGGRRHGIDADRNGRLATGAGVVLEGIEDRVAELRDLKLRERLTELVMVLALWSAGAAVAVAASRRMPAGGSRSLLIGLGVLLSAIAINALVLLMHEGMHGTLFRSPSCNRWVSVVLGFTVLMSFTAYQVMHLRHHAFLGDPRSGRLLELHGATASVVADAFRPPGRRRLPVPAVHPGVELAHRHVGAAAADRRGIRAPGPDGRRRGVARAR